MVLPRDLPPTEIEGRELTVLVRPFLPGWRLLLTGSVIAVALIAYQLASTPTAYVAETLVAMAPVQTDVQFEPSITTAPDASAQMNKLEHRQALVDLVTTGKIERSVREQLGSQLTPSERQPGALLTRIRAQLLPRSEIISIQAEADFPNDARKLASTWATTYVAEVNRIYGADDSVQSLVSQRDEAKLRSQAAQSALIDELNTSQIAALSTQISYRQRQLMLLQNSVSTGSYQALELNTLNELAQTARRFESSRQAAQVLLDNANSASGIVDTATVSLMQAQLVTLNEQPPGFDLYFQLTQTTDAAAALRTLVLNIDSARAEMNQRLEMYRAAFETARQERVDRLEQELRTLTSSYEAESAVHASLTARRDLADSTYQALARKVEERRVARTSIQRQVEIVSPPINSTTAPGPIRRQVALALLAACAVVLIGSVVKGVVHLDRPSLTPAPAFPAS